MVPSKVVVSTGNVVAVGAHGGAEPHTTMLPSTSVRIVQLKPAQAVGEEVVAPHVTFAEDKDDDDMFEARMMNAADLEADMDAAEIHAAEMKDAIENAQVDEWL